MAILPACVSSAAAPLTASVPVAECKQARTQVGGPGPSCSLASSFLGDKVRLKPTLASACAGKRMQIVGAAQRDSAGFQGEKPWDSQKALLSSIDNDFLSSREVNAVATEYPPTALFVNADDEDERDFEDGEVLHVDNESVDDEDELAVANLGIPVAVVNALAKRGITQLFPIQRAVLDPAMQGRDLIARAKTGTGKTLAFGIPIINSVVTAMEKNRSARLSGRSPRALVLAPTRELAKQVEREFMESAPMLSTVCVYGGVPITTQQRQLQRGVDIAVGTPGRIIDLIDRRSLHLQDVSFLVLDEADQMLAVGFEEDVERILEQIPQERQSMLFSATMPSWVKKLSRKYLKDPLTIDLVGESDEKLAEGIKMLAVSMAPSAKRIILSDLIAVYARGGKSIVFTQTKRDADDVALALGRTVGCEALHGDITQSQREKTLNAFREGRFSVLVATDVAARGLDIPNVDLVIHYEIPNDSETFVHRSGRTGRAGKEGTAILMHSDRQIRTMKTIENDVGCKFERIGAPHMEEVLHASSVAATALVKQVHPDVAQIFLPTAEILLAKEGTSALAAALAHLSGFSQLPAPRSLITHEEGWTTLRLIRNEALPRSVSPRMVMGVLADIWQSAADNVGKIRVIDDPKVQGAVFDLPVNTAKELLTMPTTSGDVIEEIKKLPRLAEDESVRGRGGDMYGRFSSRGAGRSSGAGRGSFDRGGRGGSRGGEWSRDRPRSSSFSDDRFSSGLRSERSERRGPFSGVCFLCNQSGHRAADCPTKH